MCRVHLSEEGTQCFTRLLDYITCSFFCGAVSIFFFFLLGIYLGEVSVDRISKGAHVEQSTSTSLEAGKEDSRQKAGYQEEEISYTRSGQLERRSVSLAVMEFSR